MSKMSELNLEIQSEIELGELSFEQIARKYNVTLGDVDELFGELMQQIVDQYPDPDLGYEDRFYTEDF